MLVCFIFCNISCGTCFIIITLGYISLFLNDRYKGFNFFRKGVKNNLEIFFLKNSPFAKRKLPAKRIFGHVLSRESLLLSAQPLHLKLTRSAKLVKGELSPFQFDLNWAKRRPAR